ncbi:PLP-dependent aminotransferase family protein [Duganella sp. BJB488]|uniref:aminotransferase-like domain-containing protein n=1 Tax=unclassified Duganella TaxID=2636909 RepID=UPI000E344FC4|nr:MULTISPECIES: PLP-dependent aminotransferase family protein [unclassified Duganella]RFP15212.1 PLP-dependent aminotransferase family protein [Duganella sp. BJB489]RFP19767.1 PLP-dependent aminotransferase family protein [Duganella sp. BJB488]RFP38155.1 PLP-dependent aminotransferase family protein [Duganella sp. BJB480]
MSNQLNLYEHLANELGGLIASRVFAPGDRLPSIRHLAQQKRLSVSTVMQALRLMEDRGLVDARPQAGYYVRHRARTMAAMADAGQLPEPAYVGINNLLMRVLKANEASGLVQMGSAWPLHELLPMKRMQKTVAAVARRDSSLLSTVSCYETNHPEFARQIARRALEWGWLDLNEIVVTGSCTEAISLCLRAVAQPGDTIAIESATYFVLLQLIESLGMKALEIPTHPATGPSIDALELAMNAGLVQAVLLIPNANNPLGCIMPDANKQRLAQLLTRHDIPLIEDDVYGDLCFTPQRPWPVKAYDSSGHVMLCASFSKAVSPGSRVGYVVAGRYAQDIAVLKMVSSGATSHFFQAVLADFLAGSAYEQQLRKMRRALSQRIARMSDAICGAFPQQCTVSEPQGGFVVWVSLPEQVDALALHADAIGLGVAFMPGQLFSASGKYRNYLRLNCGNPWGPRTEAAIATLGELVHRHAG